MFPNDTRQGLKVNFLPFPRYKAANNSDQFCMLTQSQQWTQFLSFLRKRFRRFADIQTIWYGDHFTPSKLCAEILRAFVRNRNKLIHKSRKPTLCTCKRPPAMQVT